MQYCLGDFLHSLVNDLEMCSWRSWIVWHTFWEILDVIISQVLLRCIDFFLLTCTTWSLCCCSTVVLSSPDLCLPCLVLSIQDLLPLWYSVAFTLIPDIVYCRTRCCSVVMYTYSLLSHVIAHTCICMLRSQLGTSVLVIVCMIYTI